jgi:hypothetical protein
MEVSAIVRWEDEGKADAKKRIPRKDGFVFRAKDVLTSLLVVAASLHPSP